MSTTLCFKTRRLFYLDIIIAQGVMNCDMWRTQPGVVLLLFFFFSVEKQCNPMSKVHRSRSSQVHRTICVYKTCSCDFGLQLILIKQYQVNPVLSGYFMTPWNWQWYMWKHQRGYQHWYSRIWYYPSRVIYTQSTLISSFGFVFFKFT